MGDDNVDVDAMKLGDEHNGAANNGAMAIADEGPVASTTAKQYQDVRSPEGSTAEEKMDLDESENGKARKEWKNIQRQLIDDGDEFVQLRDLTEIELGIPDAPAGEPRVDEEVGADQKQNRKDVQVIVSTKPKVWRRTHGWERPFHVRQFHPWASLLCGLIVFYGLCVPEKPRGYAGWIAAHLVCFVAMLVFGLKTTLVDPVHPKVLENESADTVEVRERLDGRECKVCKLPQRDERTKHCRHCNKCVEGFDHHCRYLNQCVGTRNYRSFIFTVVSSLALYVIQIAFAIFTLVEENPETGKFVAIIVLSIYPLFITGFLVFLLGLYAYLNYLGLTTVEWMIKRGNRKHEKRLAKEQRQLESKQAEIEARRQQAREEWLKSMSDRKARKQAQEEKDRELLYGNLPAATQSEPSNGGHDENANQQQRDFAKEEEEAQLGII